MKIRRRAAGKGRGVVGGHGASIWVTPGVIPRSIAEPARAVLPSRSLPVVGYLMCLAYCLANINYFQNHPLKEFF